VALFDERNYKAALGVFRFALKSSRCDSEAIFYMALSLYKLGQLHKSLYYWNRLKKINPIEKNLHLNMGCVYQKLGQNGLAIRHFKQELKINPISGEALYNLGALYYGRHKYKQAVIYLERCYSLKHSIDQIVDKLAYSYFKSRQLKKEVELYEDFLREHSNDAWCLNNLGAALMHLGEYGRAELYLRKAAKIDSKDKMVLRNIKKAQLCRRQK